jgi:hypothetical protein
MARIIKARPEFVEGMKEERGTISHKRSGEKDEIRVSHHGEKRVKLCDLCDLRALCGEIRWAGRRKWPLPPQT